MTEYIYQSPIGALLLTADENGLTGLCFKGVEQNAGGGPSPTGLLAKAAAQLDEYFAARRKVFDIPLHPQGTPFRQMCWKALMDIPYGKTISYRELAQAIGNPKAMRAVGGANHHNPIPIIIPCHRVIGADGSLTGYGGELWRKEWLLAHEQKM